MSKVSKKSGYVIQLYQYAHRYIYNNDGFLQFFNKTVDRRKEHQKDPYTLKSDFLVMGDFDLMQIIPIDSFRKYQDIPDLAKEWLGKRQSILLYDISTEETPTKLNYDEEKCKWKRAGENKTDEEIKKTFCCLSMLSFTNEIIEKVGNIHDLLKVLRRSILNIVQKLNESGSTDMQCEVFGTFNTSEVAIVWLSDQYTDVLKVIDYIKCLKLVNISGNSEKQHSVFFTLFSSIATTESANYENVCGKALVQVAIHDVMQDYKRLKEFARKIIGNLESSENIMYSVGEYDLVVEVPAKRAVELIQKNGILSVGKREENGKFIIEIREFLYHNIRLLYDETDKDELSEKLDEFYNNGELNIQLENIDNNEHFPYFFEWTELIQSNQEQGYGSNADYFYTVRNKLKELVSPSAGAVDTLDLMYSDYCSIVSAAYNALWVSDLHKQFKAVLHEIELLITSGELEWSWIRYQELSNAFKQQIYHLSQSSRLFFEIPGCHLRATGQYDFLMHAYYGITKKILEVIYLMQHKDVQSELIPLITVNTVPQVNSQLYFELGIDDNRVINLDIPNSIIFDPQRGILYLTHELFHYIVPQNRQKRNYYMAIFFLAVIFKKQVYRILRELLKRKIDGMEDEKIQIIEDEIFIDYDMGNSNNFALDVYDELNDNLMNYIIKQYHIKIHPYLERKVKLNTLCSEFQMALCEFAEGNESEEFFWEMFSELFTPFSVSFLNLDERQFSNECAIKYVKERVKYCQRNSGYLQQFITSNFAYRKVDREENIQKSGELAIENWSAVKEACSDIAMVSLNSLNISDYMLFCIQAWTDSNSDKTNVLKIMHDEISKNECLRFALVAEYFYIQDRIGWNDYILMKDIHGLGLEYMVFNEVTKKEFCQHYIWFYAGKDMKYPDKMKNEETALRYNELNLKAKKWLDFFEECRLNFYKHYSEYYDVCFGKILSDFDIQNRIAQLKKQKSNEYAKRLKKIQDELEKNVYLPYRKLFESIPDDFFEIFLKKIDISKFSDRFKTKRFQQDISVAHYFQKQKSLKELGALNLEVREVAKNYTDIYNNYNDKKICNDNIVQYDLNSWKFHVRSLTELIFYLRFCVDKLNKTAESLSYNLEKRK